MRKIWHGMAWDGMGWYGMGWDGMVWDGMVWVAFELALVGLEGTLVFKERSM